MDLYVSYRLKDDSWSVPTNLGDKINSSAADWRPILSPDGKYLFFSSYRSINSEDVISKSYEELMEVYRSPLNGYGTLFWVDARVVNEETHRSRSFTE
jgi:tricorn protease-like protein